jgi:transcriptional regulator with XRE-family HTH domain
MNRKEYNLRLGKRLRKVRKLKGLSLAEVEQLSNGKWKSVVIGSYERGDRSITAVRLVELARFYGVAVTRFIVDMPEDYAPGDIDRLKSQDRLMHMELLMEILDKQIVLFSSIYKYIHNKISDIETDKDDILKKLEDDE